MNPTTFIVIGLLLIVIIPIVVRIVQAWNRYNTLIKNEDVALVRRKTEMNVLLQQLEGRGQRKTTPAVQEHIVFNKMVTVKRPGRKESLPYDKRDIISSCMKRAGIFYKHAKIIAMNYCEYCKQPRRKKAKGYWEITIQYAA